MDHRVLRVDRHSSQRGGWEMVHAAPAPPLWPHVRRYCGYVEHSEVPVRRCEVPGALVTVILGLGPTIDVSEPAHPERTPQRLGSFVAGLHDSPATTEYEGEQRGIEINLDPLAAHRILGVPMRELSGRTVDLTDVLAGADRHLPKLLQDAASWEARFGLLDRFIARRLEASREPAPEVALALSRLHRSGGGASIASLAAETGWSQRRLVSGFRGVAAGDFVQDPAYEAA